jgi:hypothetical protein
MKMLSGIMDALIYPNPNPKQRKRGTYPSNINVLGKTIKKSKAFMCSMNAQSASLSIVWYYTVSYITPKTTMNVVMSHLSEPRLASLNNTTSRRPFSQNFSSS